MDVARTVERRASRRFRMKLPLVVRWTDGSVLGEASTESEDVCSRGVSFMLREYPMTGLQPGSLIEIVMTLPHEITMSGPVKVCCLGRVLRTEQEDEHVGLAAEIER